MQKKHPGGPNQGLRYNGSNGTEGGGAGGGYPAAMRLCSQGPGQPGAQQQDPKQQASQQALTGAMAVGGFTQARGQNQFFARPRMNHTRMSNVGNVPMPFPAPLQQSPPVYGPHTTQVLSPLILPYQKHFVQVQQPSGARQPHAPAPPTAANPASGSFYSTQTQPPPTQHIYLQPSHISYLGPQVFSIPPMRNSTYGPNSAPSQLQAPQVSSQQPQVMSGGGASNQGIMSLGIPPPGPQQVVTNAQQGAQLGGHLGGPIAQPGAAPQHIAGTSTMPKPKAIRSNALKITHPVTGVDVVAEMLMKEEAGGGQLRGGTAGQSHDAARDTKVIAQFAAQVAAVATDAPNATSVETTHASASQQLQSTSLSPSSTATPPPSASNIVLQSETINSTAISAATNSVMLSNGPQVPPTSSTPTPSPPTSSTPIIEHTGISPSVPPPLSSSSSTTLPSVHHQHIPSTTANTATSAPTSSNIHSTSSESVVVPQQQQQPPIPIVSAQTNSPAVDLHRPVQHASVPPSSSPARKPPVQQQQTIQQHSQQAIQEIAETKTKTKKDGRRPTPAIQPSITNQQLQQQQSTVVTSVVAQGPTSAIPPTSIGIQQQQTTAVPPQSLQKEPHPPVKREQQPAVVSQTAQQVPAVVPQPPPQRTTSLFADSFDVKNFVTPQSLHQKTSASISSVTMASASVSLEQKETNGERDDETSSAASSGVASATATTTHTSSHTTSHGPNTVGSKVQARQKYNTKTKRKEINKKGVEKEGTDMDAFVETIAPQVPPQTSQATATATTVNNTSTSSTTAVIQESLTPDSSLTTITSSTVSNTAVTQALQQQRQRQPSPPLSTTKYAQSDRDSSNETISTSVLSTSTITTSITPQIIPVATPMSDDSDSSSIEAMVAAKNQENTKVSALLNNNSICNNHNNNNNNNDNSTSTITETENNNAKTSEDETQLNTSGGDSPQTGSVIETMTIERSQPQLLPYNYKEGQWSPLNTKGKKVYDREFLLEVRNNPLSMMKPSTPIDSDVFREKPHDQNITNNNSRRNLHGSMSLTNRGDNTVPSFMKTQSQRGFPNSLSYSQPMSSKGGRAGSGGGGPRMGGGGSMGGSMRDRDRLMKGGSSYGILTPFRIEEPLLHKTANSWKPARKQDNSDKTDEELQTEKLLKAVRGILNKLTPQKFETLLSQILSLPIDTDERLIKVVYLVFSKAVDEPSFSKEYAELCRRLSLHKTTPTQQSQQQEQSAQTSGEQQQQPSATFRKLLINKCQEEFERNKAESLNVDKRMQEINDCTDVEKKKDLKLQLEEEERKIRIKKVGLVRFIGELFKLKMLTNKIMHRCVQVLLEKIDEESLECLCKLLTTIGKEFEQTSEKDQFDGYFQRMTKLAQKTPEPLVSSRIRFMLQDVIELRQKNWVPRRDENNPKTIEEIHKDAERETLMESALLSSQVGGGGRSGGGRHDSRDDRRLRQRGVAQSEDGWYPVGPSKHFTKNSYSTVEPSKLQPFKEIDNSMSLGSSNQWGHWTTGAGTKKSSNSHLYGNKFAALGRQDQDERKPTTLPSSIMNRKGPSPSPSKERASSPLLDKDRTFAPLKEAMMSTGRTPVISGSSSSTGRTAGSGPPSRDSSSLRYDGSLSSSSQQGTTASVSNSNSITNIAPVTTSAIASNNIPAATVIQNIPPMTTDEAERKTKTLIVEWWDNKNIQETVQGVQDTFPGVANQVLFLRAALNLVLDEGKPTRRSSTGHLLGVLVQENVVPHKELLKEFAGIVELASDIIIDIPHVWKYIGELLEPVIAQEVFNFADVKSTRDRERPSQGFACALAEIIKILIKDKGPGWIRTLWESSGVQMTDFVPEKELDSFIKKNNLGFIMGEGVVKVVADASLTLQMVEEKILSFLQKDNEKVLDHIGDWLIANLGEKTKEVDFIKVLTRAVIKASLKGDKFISSKLSKNEKLIKKYVDNDENRELACLYSIQNLLINELVQAPCVLVDTFQSLYESGTISRDAFLRWKEPRQDENVCDVEHVGRGVALASLQSFFVSLSEQDDTDDETTS